MNFIGKGIGGDSGGRRQQQRGGEGGNSLEEDDEEERQNTGPAGQFFPSSSSSSPSSPHHHHQQQQPQPQPTYHHPRGGWMHGGAPSASRILSKPDDNNNNNNNNNNNDDDDDDEHQQSEVGMMMVVEREHMFDKVVTPSDVGKLNRLVIPKQHAERYFPLDSSNNDKGLLLNFEDRNGKPWRFRYSYWNSSQSYVMTKGWSRFVKDKKLDAGDIVSFQRGVGGSAKDRLFIDWRHRPDAPPSPYQFPLPNHQFNFNRSNIHPWSPLFLQSQVPAAPSRSTIHSNLMLQPSNNSYRYGGPYQNIGTGSVVNVNRGSGSIIYFRSGGIPHQHVDMMQMHQRSGLMDPPALPPPPPLQPPSAVVFESVPVVHGKAAPKRLRLFGVNMDCPISNEDDQDYELPPTTITVVSNSSTTAMNTVPSSSSTIPYEQLMPYQEETHESTTMSSSSTDPLNKTTNPSSSRMSLDFGI